MNGIIVDGLKDEDNQNTNIDIDYSVVSSSSTEMSLVYLD